MQQNSVMHFTTFSVKMNQSILANIVNTFLTLKKTRNSKNNLFGNSKEFKFFDDKIEVFNKSCQLKFVK